MKKSEQLKVEMESLTDSFARRCMIKRIKLAESREMNINMGEITMTEDFAITIFKDIKARINDSIKNHDQKSLDEAIELLDDLIVIIEN